MSGQQQPPESKVEMDILANISQLAAQDNADPQMIKAELVRLMAHVSATAATAGAAAAKEEENARQDKKLALTYFWRVGCG
jgi:hypothetical protein